MAPIEDLQSRDLAWISDFVMQQVVLMLRPVIDHLHQTDMTVDHAQRSVQRLSVDLSEVRDDLDRTNRHLAILRQGMGVQNEDRCVLQRGIDSANRGLKRLDDQVDALLVSVRTTEEGLRGVSNDVRLSAVKGDELSKKVLDNAQTIQDVTGKVEQTAADVHFLKADLVNSEKRLEVWQSELRELRRSQLGIGAKIEEKPRRPPSSSQSGRANESGWPPPKKSQLAPPQPVDAVARSGSAGAEDTQNSRLPLLPKQPGASRPPPEAYSSVPRLRFSETMTKQTSNGSSS